MTTEPPIDNLATMSPQFKKDALAYVLKDQLAAKTATLNLPDDFFEFNPEFNVIFNGLKEFVEKYNCRPRRHELEEILNAAMKKDKWDETQRKNLMAALDLLWKYDEYTPNRVRDKLYDGILTHNVLQVTKQIPDYVQEGDWDGMISAMSKARHSISEEDGFVEYWTDIDERVERRKREAVRRVPTDFAPVDDLISGGVPRGSLAMVMAGSGYGKSAILAQMALNASLQGYTAAFLTLELARDDVMARMDANISGIEVSFVAEKPKRVYDSVVKKFEDHHVTPGRLYVQYYPTKSVSIHKIEEFVQRLRDEEGITLDLLIVDYFDLLKMIGSYTQKHEALEENTEILRGLAGKYDMAIWTASQVNRPGIGKETVGMEDIAAGFGKVFPLDLLITVSQTEEEKIKQVFRLHFAKSRLGPSGDLVFVQPDFERMRFKALTTEEAEKAGLYPKKKTAAKAKREPRSTILGDPASA